MSKQLVLHAFPSVARLNEVFDKIDLKGKRFTTKEAEDDVSKHRFRSLGSQEIDRLGGCRYDIVYVYPGIKPPILKLIRAYATKPTTEIHIVPDSRRY